MLRILLWRVCFEGFCLLKILGYRGRSVFYFAFGGNLNPRTLEHRRISVLSQSPLLLPNYQLVFDQVGPYQGGGFASLTEKNGTAAFGLLYEISRIDELRMDCFEACFLIGKYRKRRIRLDSREIFFYQSEKPTSGLRPTAPYLKAILDCYSLYPEQTAGLIGTLATQPTLPDLVPNHDLKLFHGRNDRWGKRAEPWVRAYDRLCLRVFVWLVKRASLFGRVVPF